MDLFSAAPIQGIGVQPARTPPALRKNDGAQGAFPRPLRWARVGFRASHAPEGALDAKTPIGRIARSQETHPIRLNA